MIAHPKGGSKGRELGLVILYFFFVFIFYFFFGLLFFVFLDFGFV